MNFKTTALLLFAAIIIAAYFFLVDRKMAPTSDTPGPNPYTISEEGTPLFTSDQLSTTAVDHMTIEAGGTRIEVARQGSDWKQTQPVQFALDSWSVEPVRDAAAGLHYMRKFTPGQADTPKLSDIGLAPPDATVTLMTAGDKPGKFTVKVGKSVPGGQAYVMVDDKPEVYVVSDALRKAVVDSKPQEWRRHTLNSPHDSRTDRITLTRHTSLGATATLTGQATGPESVEMVRHNADWALGGHDSGRVDPDKVKELLSAISTLHIDKFVADSPADLGEYGLDKPALTITMVSTPVPPAPPSPVTDASGKPTTAPASQPANVKPITQTLRIGGALNIDGDSYFATWSDDGEPGNVVFTILKADREKLDKSTHDFRDARVTTFQLADIRELSVEQPGQKFGVERDDKGTWVFRAPAPSFAPDGEAISELIDTLVLLRAQGFLPEWKVQGTPLATIRLAARGRAEPDVITVYANPSATTVPAARADEVQRIVLRNNEPTGLLVPAIRLAKALAPVATLRDRTVLDAKPDDITAIKITRAGLPTEDAVVTLTRHAAATSPATSKSAAQGSAEDRATWRLGGGGKIDAASLDAVLAAITPLHAELWTVDEKPNARDAKDLINIELTTTAGKTLSARIYPTSRLGSLTGTDAYFRVDRTVPDALQAEFRDRTIATIDVDDLKQVTVTEAKPGAANHVAVIKRSDLGVYESDAIKKVSQANAGLLFSSLADLKAVRYIAPPQMASPTAGRTLLAEAKGGTKVQIFLPSGAGLDTKASTTLPDGTVRWFTISEDAAKKLRGDLEAPPKAEQPQS